MSEMRLSKPGRDKQQNPEAVDGRQLLAAAASKARVEARVCQERGNGAEGALRNALLAMRLLVVSGVDGKQVK